MPVPLLDIATLTFEANHHPILDRLDLSIQPGEIHALLGAHGSGKTTLAYVLMGGEGYVPRGAHPVQLDRPHASAIPIVRVFHPEAKVPHEAAIGRVDKKELGTLMAREMSPEQAIELIVSGILR